MNRKSMDALENCLEQIEQGKSLDEALAGYPDLAEQLRPLLSLAEQARSADPHNLPVAALARQRSRGLALAAELRSHRRRQFLLGGIWRTALTVASVTAVLALSGNGLLLASAQSLPGDTLYGVKRSVESAQLQFTYDPTARTELETTFSQRRLEETMSLITTHRVENVEFIGSVSKMSENEWLVSGIQVILTPYTQVDRSVVEGDLADVLGMTTSGGAVDATRLSRYVEQEDHVTSTPVFQPLPTGTEAQANPPWTFSTPTGSGGQDYSGGETEQPEHEDTRWATASPGEATPASGGGSSTPVPTRSEGGDH